MAAKPAAAVNPIAAQSSFFMAVRASSILPNGSVKRGLYPMREEMSRRRSGPLVFRQEKVIERRPRREHHEVQHILE